MRERQQLFLSINRIVSLLYGPLSIAFGVFYLFTGDLLRCILSLCTLLFLFLPQMIRQAFHFRYAHLLLALYFLFILVSYSGGLIFSLSYRALIYDLCVHLFDGFFFAVAAAAIFYTCTGQCSCSENFGFCTTFCFCFSFSVNVLWELLQILVVFLEKHVLISVPALCADLLICLLGALIYCILTALYTYKGIHTYPLYATEDFVTLNVKSKEQ